MECHICFEKNEVRAALPCKHNMYCAKCIFKELVLLGNKSCPLCRAPIQSAVFTIIPKKSYVELLQEYRFEYNSTYHIYFDSKAIEKWFLDLLEYECSICSPFVKINTINEKKYLNEDRLSFYSVSALNNHLQEEHHMRVCEVCANSKQMYPHELKLYNMASYNAHINGFTDDPTLPKHIKCHACNTICYDNRHYLKHCRDNHIHCFICGVNNPHNFFVNEKALHEHYSRSHHPCLQCDYQFVGETMMDLVNHTSKEHSDQSELVYERRFRSGYPPGSPPTRVSRDGNPPTRVSRDGNPPITSRDGNPSSTTSRNGNPSTKPSKNGNPSSTPKNKNPSRSSNNPPPSISKNPSTNSSQIRFVTIRSMFSTFLEEVLSSSIRNENVEVANIIIEIALNIMDYLTASASITKLVLTPDLLTKLQACVNTFSLQRFKMDCLIPYGLSPLHATKFNKYFAKYFTPGSGWKYRYLVCSADFRMYTTNELWLCCCYFYLVVNHLLH